ncbi:hypothetical protein RclHR1_13980008 [Rhizophagus clarus]|uniref:Uncharacterized protein n=1 Tax=Rhizophagus clarus TaxID=94130 RepID=A0A2Z6QBE1_9GLOM|nr:hypothetical protein RclHR1_13980008 [Rhizophagus clarus]
MKDDDNNDLEELLSYNDNLEELLSDNDDLEESLSDIDNNNLEESLSEMSINEDIINDSNKTGEGSTLYLAKERLNRLVNLKLKHIDMCKNLCCAFTGIYINDVTCHFCNSERYIISHNSKKSQKSQKTAMYFPLLDRFRIQYADSERALKLRYRSQREECNDGYSNIFDGNLYKELVEEDSCWIVIFINANLPPSIHIKKENLLISAIIPSPNQPKDFNSFLQPIIDELKIFQEGVSIYNAVLKENYNAYLGCRFCYLKGVYSEESKHVYFPCSMPRTSNITDFDPKELLKRTENNFLNDISKIINETNRTTRLSYIKETGINGCSILLNLNLQNFYNHSQ